MSTDLRTSQLIAPFGPGAIHVDSQGFPYIIAGLDFWFSNNNYENQPNGNYNIQEFQIEDDRLVNQWFNGGALELRHPPPFRKLRLGQQNPPPNSLMTIPFLRFPNIYSSTFDGNMHYFQPATPNSTIVGFPGGPWRVVRFIGVCQNGHISNFPFREWIRCTCEHDNVIKLKIDDRGGNNLSDIWVRCTDCGRRRSLAGIYDTEELQCSGPMPWNGKGAHEDCGAYLKGRLLNQSNNYIPKIISSLYIPTALNQSVDLQTICDQIQELKKLNRYRRDFNNGNEEKRAEVVNDIHEDLNSGFSINNIMLAMEQICKLERAAPAINAGHNFENLTLFSRFRFEEFITLQNEVEREELKVKPTAVSESLAPFIEAVSLVPFLRETRVFAGFDRLERDAENLDNPGEINLEQTIQKLFRVQPQDNQRWLPAVKNFGEGIFLKFKEDVINQWINDNETELQLRFNQDYCIRLAKKPYRFDYKDKTRNDFRWAIKYVLIHSLAHMLLNQLIYQCGYSSASLRERLYVSTDEHCPMAGILIYTASGDSGGSLGGLVQMGRRHNLENVFKKAVQRSVWCSMDPVCSESRNQGTELINHAACHACNLLSETSCEGMNNGLDRTLIVGTVENRNLGFLQNLL